MRNDSVHNQRNETNQEEWPLDRSSVHVPHPSRTLGLRAIPLDLPQVTWGAFTDSPFVDDTQVGIVTKKHVALSFGKQITR